MHPRRGEVWILGLGRPEQPRPVIIVGRDDDDAPRALTTFIPVTTKDRKSEYEVDLSELHCLKYPKESVANAQSINTVETVRFIRCIGVVPNVLFKKIEQALLFAIGMT